MSSSPIILAPRTSPGFDGLNSAIDGIGGALNQYEKYAMLKKFFPNYASGKGSAQKPSGINPQAIARVIGGMQDPSDVLSKDGYAKAAQGVESQNPGMADMLDAGEQTTDESGQPADDNIYSDRIRNAMLKEYALGMTIDQVKRKAMGLPVNLKDGSQKTSYDQDLSNAIANGNYEEVNKKYPSKMASTQKIQRMVEMNKDQDAPTNTNSPDDPTSSGFQAGDVQEKNGIKYQRDAKGQWHALS